jgi:hypothetical protein
MERDAGEAQIGLAPAPLSPFISRFVPHVWTFIRLDRTLWLIPGSRSASNPGQKKIRIEARPEL